MQTLRPTQRAAMCQRVLVLSGAGVGAISGLISRLSGTDGDGSCASCGLTAASAGRVPPR